MAKIRDETNRRRGASEGMETGLPAGRGTLLLSPFPTMVPHTPSLPRMPQAHTPEAGSTDNQHQLLHQPPALAVHLDREAPRMLPHGLGEEPDEKLQVLPS